MQHLYSSDVQLNTNAGRYNSIETPFKARILRAAVE